MKMIKTFLVVLFLFLLSMSVAVWVEITGYCVRDVLKEEQEKEARYRNELECLFKPYVYYYQHKK